jgi:hypothetical protein
METQKHYLDLPKSELAEISALINSPAYLKLISFFKDEKETALSILLHCNQDQILNRVAQWRVAENSYQKLKSIPQEAQSLLELDIMLEESDFSQL